jgi:NADP-dependent 3-hydroxy acid dehydrogenase YdfG
MENRIILITGASGNLGTEVIKNLHSKGYTLCASTGSAELPAELAFMVADARNVNLAEESHAKEYVEDLIRLYPNLDTAVLLVGGFEMGSIAETDSTFIDKLITLNFKTAYHVVRPLLAHFEKRKHGQFVLIGARPALDPKAGMKMMAYSLSKSLVFQLSNLINAWGHGKHIHATVIVPSTIDTTANRKSMPEADTTKWVKASDLAETIAFVLSSPGENLRDSVLKVYNEA